MISFLLLISHPGKFIQPENRPGERLGVALEELGPIFIKFGQLLSTRPDVVPNEIAKSLKSLQDDLPHFSEKDAIAIIERELGANINSVFQDFNPSPLAAASIAQVYSAKLKEDHKDVVIKVVRPGIKNTILSDISLMRRIANLLKKI